MIQICFVDHILVFLPVCGLVYLKDLNLRQIVFKNFDTPGYVNGLIALELTGLALWTGTPE